MEVDKLLIRKDIVTTVMEENVRIMLPMEDARTLCKLLGKQTGDILFDLYCKLHDIV